VVVALTVSAGAIVGFEQCDSIVAVEAAAFAGCFVLGKLDTDSVILTNK